MSLKRGFTYPSIVPCRILISEYIEKFPATTSKLPYARKRSFILRMSVFSMLNVKSKSGPFDSGRKVACNCVGPLPMNLLVTRARARPHGEFISFRDRLEIIQGDLPQLKIAFESDMRFGEKIYIALELCIALIKDNALGQPATGRRLLPT